jgi:drug/metabolite transporter (DMT)-like permease
MPSSTELLVIGSEAILSLHPILLKTINVPLITQVLLRMGTYSSLSGVAADSGDWTHAFGSVSAIIASLGFSLMNLVHIGSSYSSYKNLTAGSALALFYTFPFLNIIGAYLFFNESVKWQIIPLIILAFIGVILIGYSENEKAVDGDSSKNRFFGVCMALLAALTETLIYFTVKKSSRNSPFSSMLQLYPIGFLVLAAYSGIEGFKDVKGSYSDIGKIIGFNAFIGFVGYAFRFYAIPLLDTSIFSILTFVGVATGYLWGLLFANEKPSLKAILGALCITGSVGILEIIKNKK